jgi:hypothetical protein
LVLNAVVSERELGDWEWTWTMRREVLDALSNWTRVTMRARDALGRRYRQTLVCPDRAVEVSPIDPGRSVAARTPLSDSRTCDPPLTAHWDF